MKILAVDSSSVVATVAVVEDDKLLGEISVNHKLTHSEKLMPLMDQLLGMLELKPSDMDLFAVANGPGSFTGLRIGISSIKGLSYATGKPAVGISTLEGLAQGVPFSQYLVCPLMDARNDQVFTALYECGQHPKEILAPVAMGIEEILEQRKGKETLFLGDGALLHRKRIDAVLGEYAHFAPSHCSMARASCIGSAALNHLDQTGDSQQLEAVYLRKSQAEREKEERERRV